MNNFETSKKVEKPEVTEMEPKVENTPEEQLSEKPEVTPDVIPEVNEDESELEDSNTEVNMDELHINSSESEQNPETGYETLGSTSSYKSTSGFETAGESVGMHASSLRPINNDQNQNYGSGYGRNIKEEVSVSLKVKNDISYNLKVNFIISS